MIMIQILNYGQVDREKIFARVSPEMDVEAIVSQIIADVRKGKDQAVIEYCRRFDRVDLRSLEVSREEIEEAKERHKVRQAEADEERL
jgi:histidinol dehydrogenase